MKRGLIPYLAHPPKVEELPPISVPQEVQLALSKRLLTALGYDFRFGRIDLSTHPFSAAFHPKDSRLTTRLSMKDPFSNILTVLHEAGHALYEMGLPEKEYGTPLCEAISLGIHESQSRFFETRIGLSLPFWKGFLPIMKKEIPELKKISAEEVYRTINSISPSFIRTDADEVTYPFHVILRFEIEKALIEGSISARDVPDLWNQKMKESLGIVPKTHSEGVLQDVHWSMGAMGYFRPISSELSMPLNSLKLLFEMNLLGQEGGKRGFIKAWLNTHIHAYGRQYRPDELVEKVSKKPFSATPFLRYIEEKFSGVKKPSSKRRSR